MRIIDRDRWSGLAGSIIASSAVSALPAAATQNALRTYVYRSLTQNGEQTLQRDLGAAYAIDTVGLANIKLLLGGAIVVESLGAASEPGSATTLATITGEDEETRAVLASFNSVSVRHLRLRWTNPDSVLDYAECGIVRAGAAFLPFTLGGEQSSDWQAMHTDPSILTRAPGGQITATVRQPFARGDFHWRWNDTAVLDRYREFWRRVGLHEPFLFQQNPNHAWTTVFARLTSDRSISVIDKNVLDVNQGWEEAL